MRERGHLVNAVAIGIGVGYLVAPTLDIGTVSAVIGVCVPVILGALLPDIDTSFGDHRIHGHNICVFGIFTAFPIVFGNLAWVWLGLLTHYMLDLLGNVRGLAVFYPFSRRFVDIPVGVPVNSRWADVVTLAVTAIELAIAAIVIGWWRGSDPTLPTEMATILGRLVAVG